MTERDETIGRHKLFVAFTFQQFVFDNIDGTGLGNVPIVLPLQTGGVTTATINDISTTVNQYAFFATFGLTDRVDVSVAVPIEESLSVWAQLELNTPDQTGIVSGSTTLSVASGFGDVVLAAKGTAWYSKDDRMALALGAELRLPSGDALNFLGSGAVGIKPYLALSRAGKVSRTSSLGYQWNGTSVLNELSYRPGARTARIFLSTISERI